MESSNNQLQTKLSLSEIKLKLQKRLSVDHQQRSRSSVKGDARNSLPFAPIIHVELAESYPTTSIQKRLYVLNKMTEGSFAYHMPVLIEIKGKLDFMQLESSFKQLIQRHEILRTSFTLCHNQVVQKVAVEAPFSLDIVQETGTRKDNETYFHKFLQPFDLSQYPLMRAQVVQFNSQEFLLLIDMHHIIADGKSWSIFIRDLTAYYSRQPILHSNSELTYRAFAVWQKQQLDSERIHQQKEYWLRQFGGKIPIVDLPLDFPRPLTPSFRGDRVHFAFSLTLTANLKQLAGRLGVSLYQLLMSLYQILVHKYTQQEDIVVGSSVEGRVLPVVQKILGTFINTVAIRTQPQAAKTVLNFVQEVKETCLKAYENQEYPFDELVNALNAHQDTSRNPLFDLFFDLHHARYSEVKLCDLELHIQPNAVKSAKLDLTLEAFDKGDRLEFIYEYATDLLLPATVERMARHFEFICWQVVQKEDCCIGHLELLTSEEQLMGSFFAIKEPLYTEKLFLDLFKEHVNNTPYCIAASCELEQLTYLELDRLSDRVAAHLQHLGIGVESVVALLMNRSLPFLISMLAVFKVGAAYVPLDPKTPLARIQEILEESQCILILSDQIEKKFGSCLKQGQLLKHIDQLIHNTSVTPFQPVIIDPQYLAYLIFTSGSTGKPKGAMLEHRGMINHLYLKVQDLNATKHDVIAQTSSQTFDVSVWQFLIALVVGGKVVVIQDEKAWNPAPLMHELIKHQVTVFETVPSHFHFILQEIESAQHKCYLPLVLKWMILNGEALPTSLYRRWHALYPHIPMINAYGPTECSDDVCHYLINNDHLPSHQTVVPIGKILTNLEAFILNKQLQMVPPGVCGDLYIKGVGLGRGYLNNSFNTANVFIPCPFVYTTEEQGCRMYQTGDLARALPDGTIEYLGRNDLQVKVRGHRIELGEIEATLNQEPSLERAVVLARENTDRHKELIAYLIAKKGYEKNSSFIRTYLEGKLPSYMVPNAFIWMDTFPLSPSGKINLKALPAPQSVDREEMDAILLEPPVNDIERKLVFLWQELLQLTQIGVQQSFFQLGGHSLLALQLMLHIKKSFDIDLPLQTFFEDPSIRGVSRAIKARKALRCSVMTQTVNHQLLEEIKPNLANRFEEFPMTEVQQAYWLGRSGIFELGNVSVHIYSEYDIPQLDIFRLETAWNHMIRRHEALRLVFTDHGTQKIVEKVPPYCIEILDLQHNTQSDAEYILQRMRQKLSHEVFPAEQWPLFRIVTVKLPKDTVRLYLSFDALILDGWSIDTVFGEWVKLYKDLNSSLPQLTVSFRDYVLAYQKLKESALYQQHKAYWLSRLDSFPLAPKFPLIQKKISAQTQRFARHTQKIPQQAWDLIQKQAREQSVSPTGFLLALFAEVLYGYTLSSHFSINLTLFDRLPLHPQINQIAGDFTSLTLLEVDFRLDFSSQESTFSSRAKRLQLQLWQDLDHHLFNGVDFLRALSSHLQKGKTELLMPIVFTSVLGLEAQYDQEIASFTQNEVYSISQTPQVWLDYKAYETNGQLVVEWDYVIDLFPEGFIDQMHTRYCELVALFAQDTATWTQPSFNMLTAKPQQQRDQYQGKPRESINCRLQELFYQQVPIQRNLPAVIAPQKMLSYQELHDKANQVAYYLVEKQVKPQQLVAIVMHKGWEQVVAALGIVISGAAYLPIDPELPMARLKELLQLSQAKFLLTQKKHLEKTLQLVDSIEHLSRQDILTIDEECSEINSYSQLPLPARQALDDLAYVIFTSGSTGMPKGVMITHRAVVNTVCDINERYQVCAADRVFALSQMNFDLSVYDIFGTLAAGGAIILPDAVQQKEPTHWLELILKHQVTVWNSVPMLVQMLVESSFSLEPQQKEALKHSLRLVLMSGDWIPVDLPAKINKVFAQQGESRLKIFSLGGATEASIWSIEHAVDPHYSYTQSIPYGKPLRNQQIHVLNDFLQPCPNNVTGNIYIGGIGLSTGYWADSAKTAQSYFKHTQWGRIYKTGDLGRFMSQGEVEFLGRNDQQVKVGGFRIELGEIETTLNAHPDLSQVVVITTAEKENRRLIAYVVPIEDQSVEEIPLITNPQERLELILAQHRTPREINSYDYYALVSPLQREEDKQFYFQRKTHRDFDQQHQLTLGNLETWLGQLSTFSPTAIKTEHCYVLSLNTLTEILSGLLPLSVEEGLLPKFLYPSAGSIYPVETYLYVGVNAVQELSPGFYYYERTQHALKKIIVSHDSGLLPSEGVSLYFLANLSKIEPLYGQASLDFCSLEAGYLTEVISQRCIQKNIAVCPSCNWQEFAYLQELLSLSSKEIFVQKLSICPAAIEDASKINMPVENLYLYIKEGAVASLSRGWYQYQTLSQKFVLVSEEDFTIHPKVVDTYAIFHRASFALFFLGSASTPHQRLDSLLLAGAVSQALMLSGVNIGIGLCPIGLLDARAKGKMERALSISSQSFLHCLFGGAIKQEVQSAHTNSQIKQGCFEEALSNYLKQRLPYYMQPHEWNVLEKLPMTANQKVDRKVLNEFSLSHPKKERQKIPPQTAVEKQLMEIWSAVLGIDDFGIEDNFFELGGNSLLTTKVSLQVRTTFHCQLSLKQFFESPTIMSLAHVLQQQQSVVANTDWYKDLDLHSLLALKTLPNFVAKTMPEKVFLTGATGFLGAYLLKDLLQETQSQVYCLVRASNRHDAMHKLKCNFSTYHAVDLFEEKRIVPVVGDLEKSFLGLSEQEFNYLAQQMDAIYHNGAYVHHIYDYKKLRNTNVGSTIELLKLSLQYSLKPFYYISTLAAVNEVDATGMLSEEFLTQVPSTEQNGYQKTKWVSENLLKQAHALNLPVKIFRPNTITGDSQSGICAFSKDHFWLLVKGCIQMGYAPNWTMQLDLLPVDYVSKAIVQISLATSEKHPVYNLTNLQSLTWLELIAWLNSHGYAIEVISDTEWKDKHIPNLTKDNALFPLLPIYLSTDSSHYVENKKTRAINQSHTVKLLSPLYVKCPAVNTTLLHNYLSYFNEQSFLYLPDANASI